MNIVFMLATFTVNGANFAGTLGCRLVRGISQTPESGVLFLPMFLTSLHLSVLPQDHFFLCEFLTRFLGMRNSGLYASALRGSFNSAQSEE